MGQVFLVQNSSFFQLQIGHIVHQNIGYQRDYFFDIPALCIDSDLDLTNLDGRVRVTRAPQGLLIEIKMKALTALECDRCLRKYLQPISFESTELYAFSETDVTETGYLFPEDGNIDLEPIVREEMLLSVPIKYLCRQDCSGLCPICGVNLNNSTCDHDEISIDPRLAGLKSLLIDESAPNHIEEKFHD